MDYTYDWTTKPTTVTDYVLPSSPEPPEEAEDIVEQEEKITAEHKEEEIISV